MAAEPGLRRLLRRLLPQGGACEVGGRARHAGGNAESARRAGGEEPAAKGGGAAGLLARRGGEGSFEAVDLGRVEGSGRNEFVGALV